MADNIILCGTGGQGTVLAARLLSSAAMARGLPVMSAETIGMAQRGGSVSSHLRMGEGIHSPMIARGTAGLILGFEPGEAVRMLPYLAPDGLVVVSGKAVMPVTATLTGGNYRGEDMVAILRRRAARVVVVDPDRAMAELGSTRVLNLILLGYALESGALDLTEADLREAIARKLPPKLHELNYRALAYARGRL